MRRAFFVSATVLMSLNFVRAETHHASAAAVIQEMNIARQQPQRYAAILEQLRQQSSAGTLVLPGGTRVPLREGGRSVDEAIRFLRTQSPLPPLNVSAGMSHAAQDHCAEQSGGAFGHVGSGGSHACDRMNRYGAWHGGWAENVAYGKADAQDVVLALIIDDGQPARKHRKNIFNASYGFAGAAFGNHARFGSVCSIDFAVSYTDRGAEPAEPLVARNF